MHQHVLQSFPQPITTKILKREEMWREINEHIHTWKERATARESERKGAEG